MGDKNFVDYYACLGLDSTASIDEIEKACLERGGRLLAEKKAVPDSAVAKDFALIEKAYATLSNASSKVAYDRDYNDFRINKLAKIHEDGEGLFKRRYLTCTSWLAQPKNLAICAATVFAVVLVGYWILDYQESVEAETMQRMRYDEIQSEMRQKQEALQEEYKERQKRGLQYEAEHRHRELISAQQEQQRRSWDIINEQRQTREELEKLRKDVDEKDRQRRLYESFRR